MFAAAEPDGSEVVLRTPAGGRFQSNANDRHVDTRSLLRWEYAVAQHLAGFSFPVAAARELVLGGRDVLVSYFVPDDGRAADQVMLGRLLPARITQRFATGACFTWTCERRTCDVRPARSGLCRTGRTP